ncbi:putative G-protein coupled receptor 139 [Rhinoraja longicauda]
MGSNQGVVQLFHDILAPVETPFNVLIPVNLTGDLELLAVTIYLRPLTAQATSLCPTDISDGNYLQRRTGNIVAIIVIGRGNCGLSRCITHYLVAMAAADLMAVFFNVAIYYIEGAIFRGYTHTVPCTLQRVMAYVSLDCSVWLTVAFPFDCFVAICCQGFKTRYCTVRIVRVAIAAVYVVSLLRNIPYYFAFYSYYIDLPIGCLEMPEYFFHYGWLAFSWIRTFLTPLVPFFVIVLLNILIVRSIVVASRACSKLRAHAGGEKQEDPEMQSRRKSIILLFCVSGSFILLCLTDVCFFIYTHIANLHQVQSLANPRNIAISTADMLKILSSCTNTFIYVLTQSKARDELKNAIKYPFTICLKIVQK